jgi:hypothetical protein
MSHYWLAAPSALRVKRFFSRALTGVMLSSCGGGDHAVTSPAPSVASVTVSPNPATLGTDSTVMLSATARDASGNVLQRAFTWSSSNAGVATVNAGVVKGISTGPVNITATADGVSGTAAITVAFMATTTPFDNLVYTTSAALTYTAKDGSSVTANVFPGQVAVTVDPSTSPSAVAQLIQANGATIRAQLPGVGLYIAVLSPANVPGFLSAMYQNALVTNAYPNSAVSGRARGTTRGAIDAAPLLATALVQTIDVSQDLLCGSTTHKDAVGTMAAQSGVTTQVNDITVSGAKTANAASAWFGVQKQMLSLLQAAQATGSPVIINISMGPTNDNLAADKQFYNQTAALLQAASQQFPGILDKALIFIAGSDQSLNETSSFTGVRSTFPNAAIWKSLYFVESEEGIGAAGCGVGYVTAGTSNVLAAKGCNVTIPGTTCVVNGTSFATPAIANIAAQTYTAGGGAVPMNQIGDAIWAFQTSAGRLPTVSDLAFFRLVTLTSGTGAGSVSTNPSAPTYLGGTTVTVTAAANAGAAFTGWTGACTGTGTCAVLMDANKTVTAAFNAFVTTYDGTYMGTLAGDIHGPTSGIMAFTVHNGTITLTAPIDGQGSVTAAGGGTFGGPILEFTLNFTGNFSVSPAGGLAASGSWVVGGATGGGTWSTTGARTP